MTGKPGGVKYRLRIKQDSSFWEFIVDTESFTLGRTKSSDYAIPLQILSSVHLQITHHSGNNWLIVDKKSTNGTFIDGNRMEPGKPYQAKSPIELRIGKTTPLIIEIEEKVKVEPVLPSILAKAEESNIVDFGAKPDPKPKTQTHVPDLAAELPPEVLDPTAVRRKVDLESELQLLEARVEQARMLEQLSALQASDAQKVHEKAEELRASEEARTQDLRQANDRKQQEILDISRQLDGLNDELSQKLRNLKEIEGNLKEVEGDLADADRTLQIRIDERKIADADYLDLQRRISALAEQEKDLKAALEAAKADTQIFRAERDKIKAALDEAKSNMESFNADFADKERQLDELRATVLQHEARLTEALKKESEAHRELHKSLKMIAEKEQDAIRLNEESESQRRELDSKREEITQINTKLDALRQKQIEEQREQQTISTKLQSLKDSLQLAEAQRKASEVALETVRAEVLAGEGRLKRLASDTQEGDSRLASIRAELSQKEVRVQELDQVIRQLQENESLVSKEYSEKKNALRLELENLAREEKEKLDAAITAARAAHANWEKSERERIVAELESQRAEIAKQRSEFADWQKNEKQKVQSQFSTKAEQLERELAERQQKELVAMEEAKAKWNKERDAKRPLETKEIVRSTLDILGAHIGRISNDVEKKDALLVAVKKDLESVVKAVLISGKEAQVETHLRSMVVKSPEETLKAARKRKVWAAQAGLFLFVLILGAIFPQIPRSIMDAGASALSRDPQSADKFVERIRLARANRPKFMPKRDGVYRNTYAENLIYLDDYSEIKNDEQVKKEWTLALNKFFINTLSLDEKIVVTFMAIEAPLVRELTQMLSRVQVSTQDADISRMRAFEDMTLPRLQNAVGGPDNFQKLREFELKFYSDYKDKVK